MRQALSFCLLSIVTIIGNIGCGSSKNHSNSNLDASIDAPRFIIPDAEIKYTLPELPPFNFPDAPSYTLPELPPFTVPTIDPSTIRVPTIEINIVDANTPSTNEDGGTTPLSSIPAGSFPVIPWGTTPVIPGPSFPTGQIVVDANPQDMNRADTSSDDATRITTATFGSGTPGLGSIPGGIPVPGIPGGSYGAGNNPDASTETQPN